MDSICSQGSLGKRGIVVKIEKIGPRAPSDCQDVYGLLIVNSGISRVLLTPSSSCVLSQDHPRSIIISSYVPSESVDEALGEELCGCDEGRSVSSHIS